MGRLTTTELARAMGLAPSTVRLWANRKEIPCLRNGPRGHRRFDLAEVRAALEPASGDPAPVEVDEAAWWRAHRIRMAALEAKEG